MDTHTHIHRPSTQSAAARRLAADKHSQTDYLLSDNPSVTTVQPKQNCSWTAACSCSYPAGPIMVSGVTVSQTLSSETPADIRNAATQMNE